MLFFAVICNLNFHSLFNDLEKDSELVLAESSEQPNCLFLTEVACL